MLCILEYLIQYEVYIQSILVSPTFPLRRNAYNQNSNANSTIPLYIAGLDEYEDNNKVVDSGSYIMSDPSMPNETVMA